MAVKPYQEGKAWSIRLRVKGQTLYRTGFATISEARKEAERLQHQLTEVGRPAHGGPWRTTVAEALQQYARERLPSLKGARQDAGRINCYLRAAGLDVIELTPIAKPDGSAPVGVVYWTVTLVPSIGPRKIAQSLAEHRQRQSHGKKATAHQISVLAHTPVAEVERHQIQQLLDVMGQDGYGAASIGLERAELRRFFNYASKTWNWPQPARNPATQLTLPKIDNARDRILNNKEWRNICTALEETRNLYVGPALALLLQTAMRSSEALVAATWGDFDAERCILRLRDAKAGKREVPLNPDALAVLKHLAKTADSTATTSRILPLSYEALKAAWKRACERAGVTGVHLHDLRHTSATRFALELGGNMPVLKIITGHKTDSQLMRYINITPDDVVRLMHGRPLDEENAPAGLILAVGSFKPLPAPVPPEIPETLPTNVIRLERKRA